MATWHARKLCRHGARVWVAEHVGGHDDAIGSYCGGCVRAVNSCGLADVRVPTESTVPLEKCTLDSSRMLTIAFAFGVSIFVLVHAAAPFRLAPSPSCDTPCMHRCPMPECSHSLRTCAAQRRAHQPRSHVWAAGGQQDQPAARGLLHHRPAPGRPGRRGPSQGGACARAHVCVLARAASKQRSPR